MQPGVVNRTLKEKTRRIGLIAAWGRYPIIVAEALKRQGYDTYCLGVKEHADEAALLPLVADFRWIGLGALGAAIRYFRRHQVQQATMAGKFHKRMLFHRWTWVKHLPDWTALRTFYPHMIGTHGDRKDDTLLSTLIGAFEKGGVRFLPATDFVPEILVKFSQLTHRAPTRAQRKDIEFGWRLAREMGRLDIGQSVVVKDRAILAVEAIEGTDECIRRAGQLCRDGGFTVVKLAKPQQDMRFDVPTIGIGTLESLAASGGRVLAIEAGKTIVVDEPQVIAMADRLGLAIVALDEATALACPGDAETAA